MTRTSALALLLLVPAACTSSASIDEPDASISPDVDAGTEPDDPDDPPDAMPDAPPPPELPFVVQPAAASTAPSALFPRLLASDMRSLLRPITAEPAYAIVDQRIVSKVDTAIAVTISLQPPTGMFSRTIASDAVQSGTAPVAAITRCSIGNVATNAPECETRNPAPTVSAASGPISQARWKITLVDDATSAPIAGCTNPDPLTLSCSLSARPAGTAYRIRVIADAFTDLWNQTTPVYTTIATKQYNGTASTPEYKCLDLAPMGGDDFCRSHLVFGRYTALDGATLAFDPLSITVAAAGATETAQSPALNWNGGNPDLPGPTY